jgi:hypothetical protein
VEPAEIDIALEELEQRLERLRSLYEQYFLGIEKVEPSIARKDVERRFWLLRRTKLRNTARRFRMQLLVQRYNTFQQYWMRICRQIEAGTYIRHVLRAEKKFGSEAVTIKARRREAAMAKARELAAAARKPSQAEMGASADANVPPSPNAAAPASAPPSSDGLSSKATVAIPAVRIPRGTPDGPTPFEPRPRPKRIPREEPEDAEIEIHDTPVPAPVSFYTKPTTKLPAIPAAGRGEHIGKHLPPAPASTRFTERPQVSMTPTPGSTTRFSIPAARKPTSGGAGAIGTPAPSRVAPAERAGASGALSEKRVQELHAQLSAEKKRLADNTAVSLDSLAKSLNETAAKLKSMHGSGKQVDFRVVVKGGKAMVKPVLK